MRLCDWHGFNDHLRQLEERIERGEKAANPSVVIALSNSPQIHFKAARICVMNNFPQDARLGEIPQLPRHERIRIAYFSADFQEHPVALLTAELYEMHDRNRFEVIGISLGFDTKDAMRQRLSRAFDSFIDVSGKSDAEVVELARKLKIDIAVCLGGHTAGGRLGIFALRAAPIQINYLGFPGTIGAEFFDYLVADEKLIPRDSRQYYVEKIAYLPDSYQANDSKRRIAETFYTRKELGLPEPGFVYCCFNNLYKILPATFDCWMRILKSVDNSVLWLLEESALATENLRREAVQRGVGAERLVFGGRLPLAAHLARHGAADLFLGHPSLQRRRHSERRALGGIAGTDLHSRRVSEPRGIESARCHRLARADYRFL